jgi:hypothetical protein
MAVKDLAQRPFHLSGLQVQFGMIRAAMRRHPAGVAGLVEVGLA